MLKLHDKALEWDNRRDLKIALGITVTCDTEPMSLVECIFKKLRVRVCCVRQEGPKENQKRFYRITGEIWNEPDRLTVLAAFDQRYADLIRQPERLRVVASATAFVDTQSTKQAATAASEVSAQTVESVL